MSWYRIVDAADVPAELDRTECATTEPRYSNDGSQAAIRYTSEVDGSIDHEAVLAIVRGADWNEPV